MPARTLPSGQNSDVFVLDERLILRFPRNGAVLRRLATECSILTRLEPVASLPVPRPLYVNLDAPVGEAFMGYALLLGEPLWPATADAYPGVAAMLPRARLYAQTFALQEALHGVEHGDDDAFRRGMANYV